MENVNTCVKVSGNKYLATQMINPNVKDMLQRINISSPNVCLHCVYTAIYASMIAEKMDLNKNLINEITIGCLVHDLGKISIPAVILNKPTVLTDKENAVMRLHPEFGELQTRNVFSSVANEIVLLHHEKSDGSGYPSGITSIPLHVQIVTVADMYEALTSERCYKKTYGPLEALKILKIEAKKEKINQEIVAILETEIKERLKEQKRLEKLSIVNHSLLK